LYSIGGRGRVIDINLVFLTKTNIKP